MEIQGGGGACLTVEEPGELFTITEEKLDLKTRGVECHQFTPIQLRVSRAQNNETRLGRVFPVEEHYKAQATLQRLVPHHSGIQMQMRCLFHGTEVLETAQVLEPKLP